VTTVCFVVGVGVGVIEFTFYLALNKSFGGNTALDFAEQNQLTEIVQYLKSVSE
jgi:hypothetical protein